MSPIFKLHRLDTEETFGQLFLAEDGTLRFEGDVEKSAKVFFDYLCANHTMVDTGLERKNSALDWLIENCSGTLGTPDGWIDFSDKNTIRQEIESLSGQATGKPVPGSIILPDRLPNSEIGEPYDCGWNDCIDKTEELNK